MHRTTAMNICQMLYVANFTLVKSKRNKYFSVWHSLNHLHLKKVVIYKRNGKIITQIKWKKRITLKFLFGNCRISRFNHLDAAQHHISRSYFQIFKHFQRISGIYTNLHIIILTFSLFRLKC